MNENLLAGVNENTTLSKLLGAAAILVTLVSEFFAWLMTAHGLTLTRILPTEAFLPQWALSALLAFASHACLVIVYVTLSRSFSRRRLTLSLALAFPFALLLATTTYFSFFSISYEAKGNATLEKRLSDIGSLNQKVTESDRHLKSTFLLELEALEKLARDSDRGFDVTGIAACGRLCRTYLTKRSEIVRRFAQFGQELPSENLDMSTNITQAWGVVAARYDRFLKKLTLFDEFLKEMSLPPVSWSGLKEQFAKVQESFAGNDAVDRISLVATRANGFLAGLLSGEGKNEEAGFFLFLLLAGLPGVINFSMMLALASLYKPVQETTQELEQTVEHAKTRFSLERELVIIRNLHELFKKAQGKIFRNDVETKEQVRDR